MDRLAQQFLSRAALGERRGFDRVQNLLLASSAFLDAICVAIENFEDRQRLSSLGQFARHVQGRGERHESMEAHVIFSAEGARVRQRGRCDQLSQIRARFQFGGQAGDELLNRGLLHKPDERFEWSEVECICSVRPKGGGQTQFMGQTGANGGNEHAAAYVCKEFTPSM